jgi:hypothetical protein
MNPRSFGSGRQSDFRRDALANGRRASPLRAHAGVVRIPAHAGVFDIPGRHQEQPARTS